MRLIDADALQERFEKVKKESERLVDVAQIIGVQAVIDCQPIAYDVDKVVERLERYSQNIELIYPTDQGYDYEDAIGIDINKAKEIVKSGGIE